MLDVKYNGYVRYNLESLSKEHRQETLLKANVHQENWKDSPTGDYGGCSISSLCSIFNNILWFPPDFHVDPQPSLSSSSSPFFNFCIPSPLLHPPPPSFISSNSLHSSIYPIKSLNPLLQHPSLPCHSPMPPSLSNSPPSIHLSL